MNQPIPIINAEIPMTKIVIHPITFDRFLFVLLLSIFLSLAILIIATKIGTAITPFITAV